MNFFAIFILGISVAQCLGSKGPLGRRGPHGHPVHPPLPQKREEVEINEKGSGWGWNGPPAYETFSCANPSTIVNPNYDPNFYGKSRIWYLTGATTHGYSLYARFFLGRPVASQDELNQMCPALYFGFNDLSAPAFGYGLTFQFTCGVLTDGCSINTDPSTYDAALGVDVFSGFVGQKNSVVAADNMTYTVWLICRDNKYADIELVTTQPYASPEAVEAYLAAAQQYGIPLSQLQLLRCNSPFQGPYPPPFQNYPNGNGWTNIGTGWGQAPPTNGWSQNPLPNGWNSNPQPSGWTSSSNLPSNGWSGNNNGWGGHSTLVEKTSDLQKEPVKLAEEKPNA